MTLWGCRTKACRFSLKPLSGARAAQPNCCTSKSAYTNVQLVLNLLIMAFLLPCINAAIVVIKERGAATAAVMLSAVMVYAMALGRSTALSVSLAGDHVQLIRHYFSGRSAYVKRQTG